MPRATASRVVGGADGSTVEGNTLAGAGAGAVDVVRVTAPAVVAVGPNDVSGWHVEVSLSEYVSNTIRDHPLLPVLGARAARAPALVFVRRRLGSRPYVEGGRVVEPPATAARRRRRDAADPALPGRPGGPTRRTGRAMNRLLIGTLCALAFATAACDQAVTAGPHAAPDAQPRRPPRRRWAATAAARRCRHRRPADGRARGGGARRPDPPRGRRLRGAFRVAAAGTAGAPITLCGPPDRRPRRRRRRRRLRAAPRPRRLRALVGLHGAQRPEGRDGRRPRRHRRRRRLTVTEIGDEAIHLRDGSTDNVVRGTRHRDTGLRARSSARASTSAAPRATGAPTPTASPTAATATSIEGNDITDTTAESIDIKEGTTGGTVLDNTFDGSGMTARRLLGRRQGQRLADRGQHRRRLAGGRLPDPRDRRRLGHGQHLRRQHRPGERPRLRLSTSPSARGRTTASPATTPPTAAAKGLTQRHLLLTTRRIDEPTAMTTRRP